MKYKNRIDAAQKLLPFLEKYKNEDSIILAIPRGGVPLGYYLAKAMGLPLELLLTKKIGHPRNGEFAIGAVSLDDYIVEHHQGVSMAYINSEIRRIKVLLKERQKRLMGNREPTNLKNKTVIIVDDGIATGNTLLLAIRLIRKSHPAKIVVASPVAPEWIINKFKIDDFLCPLIVGEFEGVGGYYQDFSEVTDGEVERLLNDINIK